MILSKASLEIVRITKTDKQERLSMLHITENGDTIATNGRSLLAVSPVSEAGKKSFPLMDKGQEEDKMTLPATFVEEVIKNIPKDVLFKGALEHCQIESVDNDTVVVYMTDGKRTNSIKGRKDARTYVPYEQVLDEALNYESKKIRIVLNLRRLLTLLKTIDKVCPDSTGETPVFLEFSEGKDVIVIRAYNRKTQQDIVAVLMAYRNIEGKFQINKEWESVLTRTEKRLRRKKIKK